MSGEELDLITVEGIGLVPRGRLMVQFRCVCGGKGLFERGYMFYVRIPKKRE